MNYLKLFLFSIILIGCKKKSFADNIVLTNNNKIDMKFQEFNEGIGEYGSSIIYIGKIKDFIPIKYYVSMFAPPPPPRPLGYVKTEKDINDSIVFNRMRDKYFHSEFGRMQFSNKPVKFDSLTHDLLEIVVKPNDTIPHFILDSSRNIKAYQSFPVFVKNISGRKITLREYQSLGIFVLNKKNKWQLIWNDNAFVCGDDMLNRRYWILNPNEIIVFSVNYFKGEMKTKFKVGLSDSFLSKEFEGNINPKLFEKQSRIFELQ
ncbi:hypothetical protein Q73A0000_12340 [Kaistella flava (ex Peng et al. 2021)]|uniref:Lipoprotein n=1 Tax=Kaistella flava (ex Peng et al. 2021) TaxID=2038776 RepID=A0A7M2YB71_9FLAO|nr:hypothetical protein [Kaistella flava (ex Peng et al. 2021)]QOW11089.1 hypothetical protein Q73A0000_12340 [Kaistella flava (ex Peng et al. 2021)]